MTDPVRDMSQNWVVRFFTYEKNFGIEEKLGWRVVQSSVTIRL